MTLSDHPSHKYKLEAIDELLRWGIEPTEESIHREVRRIVQRLEEAE